MLTEKARLARVHAGSVLRMIDRMQSDDKKNYDLDTLNDISAKVERLAEIPTRIKTGHTLGEVNDPYECVKLIKGLNQAIDLMWCLSDSAHYLDYIWNAGTDQDEHLKDAGITEEWIDETACKLETLRMILVGCNLNYAETVNRAMEEVADALYESNQRLEEWNRRLDYDNRKLKEEKK